MNLWTPRPPSRIALHPAFVFRVEISLTPMATGGLADAFITQSRPVTVGKQPGLKGRARPGEKIVIALSLDKPGLEPNLRLSAALCFKKSSPRSAKLCNHPPSRKS